MNQIVEEKENIFTITLRGNLGESILGSMIEFKGWSWTFVSLESTLDMLVSNFNNMNSFTYGSSNPLYLECFSSNNDENDEIKS